MNWDEGAGWLRLPWPSPELDAATRELNDALRIDAIMAPTWRTDVIAAALRVARLRATAQGQASVPASYERSLEQAIPELGDVIESPFTFAELAMSVQGLAALPAEDERWFGASWYVLQFAAMTRATGRRLPAHSLWPGVAWTRREGTAPSLAALAGGEAPDQLASQLLEAMLRFERALAPTRPGPLSRREIADLLEELASARLGVVEQLPGIEGLDDIEQDTGDLLVAVVDGSVAGLRAVPDAPMLECLLDVGRHALATLALDDEWWPDWVTALVVLSLLLRGDLDDWGHPSA